LGPEGHYILFTPRSLSELLKRHGFTVKQVRTDTLTQWFQPADTLVNAVLNKIVYCLLFPFFPLLFHFGLGDNIEICAKKTSRAHMGRMAG
jgi:hypothetical protein